MPTLQVRDLPDELYDQLSYLAEREHRSLTQEAIVLLKQGIAAKMGGRSTRQTALEGLQALSVDSEDLPDPVTMVREDRDL